MSEGLICHQAGAGMFYRGFLRARKVFFFFQNEDENEIGFG